MSTLLQYVCVCVSVCIYILATAVGQRRLVADRLAAVITSLISRTRVLVYECPHVLCPWLPAPPIVACRGGPRGIRDDDHLIIN